MKHRTPVPAAPELAALMVERHGPMSPQEALEVETLSRPFLEGVERILVNEPIGSARDLQQFGRRVAELSALYVEALQDGCTTAEERQEMMELGATVKTLLADIERHCAPKSERAQ